jgi:hypothetical protein
MKDANEILEQLLLPISFPWSQCKKILYKTVPRDIDEMTSILNVDGDDSDHELSNEVTHRRMNKPSEPTTIIPLSLARSSDPGVVELCTYVKPFPKRCRRSMLAPARVQDPRNEDPMLPGELSLRMYSEVQAKKRLRDEFKNENSSTKFISFRVGSTSSRASIFDGSDPSTVPLFLLATYPRQLHEGTKRHGLDAYEDGIELGSYNCRILPPKRSVIENPTSKNRFVVGRTRLIWSEKERSESTSQRCAVRSVLNGLRLETNAIKRPLNVKVAVRVNGVLLSCNRSHEQMSVAGHKSNSEVSYSYSNKAVHDALNGACSILVTTQHPILKEQVTVPPDYSQCTLNTTKFVADIGSDVVSSEQQQRQTLNIVRKPRDQISIQRKVAIYRSTSLRTTTNASLGHVYNFYNDHEMVESSSDSISGNVDLFHNGDKSILHNTQIQSLNIKLNIVPPRLDCLPTEDGLIRVSCTMTGKIYHEAKLVAGHADASSKLPKRKDRASPVAPYSSLLLSVLASETGRCVICWNADAPFCSGSKSQLCR